MRHVLLFFLLALILFTSQASEEDCARSYVQFANKRLSHLFQHVELLRAKFYTEITSQGKEELIKSESLMGHESRNIRAKLLKFNWQNFSDPDLKYQIKKLSQIGETVLPAVKYEEFKSIVNSMIEIYGTVKFKDFNDPQKMLTLTEVRKIFSIARNPAEARHFWLEFKDGIGKKVLKLFPKYVKLKNEASQLLGLTDGNKLWADIFDDPTIPSLIELLMEQVSPFYKQIMAYLRFHLREIYGLLIPQKSPIPAHLTGNLNADDFQWLTKYSQPCETRPLVFPDLLEKTSMTRIEKYKLAEDFYVSIGLKPIPKSVWDSAVFETTPGIERYCHPSVWDATTEFLIVDCLTPEDLTYMLNPLVVLGNIYVWEFPRKQPFCLRRRKMLEPLAYSLSTLGELSIYSVKFLNNLRKFDFNLTAEDHLNNMFYVALKDLPTFPIDYAVYLWRMGVFSGAITEENYNCHWWNLLIEHQGIEPPIVRTNKSLDCATNTKLLSNSPSLTYFLGRIIGYQLFKEFCIKTGQYDPKSGLKNLSECSLYGHKIVGEFLTNGLKFGAMKKWTYVSELVTGKTDLSAEGLLEYFDPLINFLANKNNENGEIVGWEMKKEICVQSTEEDISRFSYKSS